MTTYLESVGPHGAGWMAQRFNRAPVWARQELDRQAREIAALKYTIAADQDPESDTTADPFDPGRRREVGRTGAIRHVFSSGVAATVSWFVNKQGHDCVDVMLRDAKVLVEPSGAANTVVIRAEPW